MRVWLPYASVEEAARRLGGLPNNVEVDCYRGERGEPWPDSIAEVEFFVLPYLKGLRPLAAADQMTSLKVVQTLTAGVDDVLPVIPVGVTLCNAAGVHDASTAELAVGLALAAGRHLDVFARQQTERRWVPSFGCALADRRVLILGYGRIGAAIEARLAGFEVASIVRVAQHARSSPEVHSTEELLDLLPEADVVVISAPLTAHTRGLIGAEALKRLPDGALVVNVARGPLVVTDALVAECASGRLTAALDVTDPEPLPAEHPLWTTEGVLICPHVGGASSAFFPRADRLVKAQLCRYAAGEPLTNVVVKGDR